MRGLAQIFARVNLRHLRRHRLRTLLTVAGIAAGVALTFSISVINSTLLSTFRSSIRELAGSAELEVSAPDQTGLDASLVRAIETVDGVDNAVPAVRATTRISGFVGSRRSLVVGATPELATLLPTALGPSSETRVRLGGDFNGILLSESLAAALGVDVGDRVAVETPNGTTGIEVSGTIGGDLIRVLNGGDVAVLPLPAAQDVFAKPDRVDSIYVVADPSVPLPEVEAAIRGRVGAGAIVGPPGERGRGFERVFSSLGTLLSMGGTVALFVALFVVYNTMSMSLAERRREISMILAFGAGRRAAFGAFLAEAAALGTVASVLGLGGGYLLARSLVQSAVDAYRFLPLSPGGPVVVSGSSVAIALVGGLLVSLVGASVPARRVLRVAPIESLRPDAAYEWQRAAASERGGRIVVVGIAGVMASILSLVAFLFVPEERWIVTVGLLLGLTGVTFLLPRIVPFALAVIRPIMVKGFGATGRLSADALAKNPGRSTFTVAALVLTLGLVVAVASALASYESQVERTAGALVGAPLYVTSQSYTGITSDQPLSVDVRDDLEAVDGVAFVYPLRFALLDLDGEQALLLAVPVEEALERGATTELDAITDDPRGFLEGLEGGEIVVSRLTAETRALATGDSIAIPTPRGFREFDVAGVYDDLVSFDSFYMGYETYARIWDDDKVDEFGVIPQRGEPVGPLRKRLETVVGDLGIPASVHTRRELIDRILRTIEGTFSLANGLQLAALVVAALTIANTMFTAILERRWEMALERALGMSSAQLARSVLLEAAGIGVIGGVGGALLGTVSGFFMTQAMEAEFAWRIPFETPWALVFLALAGGIAIAAGAGLFPSRLAVRAPIIESLRYE